MIRTGNKLERTKKLSKCGFVNLALIIISVIRLISLIIRRSPIVFSLIMNATRV